MTDLAYALLVLTIKLHKAGSSTFTSLGFSWREALMLLYIERGLRSPTELSKQLSTVFPAVSALGAKFEKSGLLQRETVETDGRQVRYTLTAKGRTVCTQLRQAWEAHLPLEADAFTDDELDTFIRIALSAQKV